MSYQLFKAWRRRDQLTITGSLKVNCASKAPVSGPPQEENQPEVNTLNAARHNTEIAHIISFACKAGENE